MSRPAWVWGLPLSPMTREQAVEAVMKLIEAGRPSFFITANTHYAMLTAERPELRPINDRAAFLLADGTPLVWASRRGPTPLPERVTGSDLVFDLCERAARRGHGVYLLGGAEGVADEAARRLVDLYPGLRVVGTASPPPGSLAGEGCRRLIAEVRAARPDLLMVALGQPKGELWLAEHLDELGVPACVQVGATLDFVAGRVRRAPRLLQRMGMEWAFRIYTDPSRLAPRYAKNALFLLGSVARDLAGARPKAGPPPAEGGLAPAAGPGTGLPRVVVVAEHASAIFGGEAILPLHVFRKLRARGVEAWLVVHSRTRDELAGLMPEELDRISFITDTGLHILMWRLGRLIPARVGYFTLGFVSRLSSQRMARRIVRGLVAEHKVDVVHQPIPVSPREPSIMHGLGAPVVMGPMNGGMTYPPAFESRDRKLAIVGSLTELGRRASVLMNRLMPGKLRAETLLVANDRTCAALPSGVRGEVVELVENGVDPALWLDPIEPGPPRPEGDPVRFVFVGRLVDWKAVDLLLEAFRAVVAEVPSTLDILGDGPMRGELEAQAGRLGLVDSARFAGWLEQPDCARKLRRSDALVLPSLYECGGAVVLEAMACGLPCVATNWGGPADYLDESCGFLVDPSSRESFVAGLADAMLRLARSPELRASMGRAALEKVSVGTFNWDFKIDRILEIYAETIDRRSPKAPRPEIAATPIASGR